ncbi:HTH domain-containing protein [Chitinophaga niabensis]|jgi:predicted DNA-binding transcriptional regulator YafY|uniref:HTH domain-containing protein n=1 Tax=Chitinophaga TaxID=79328 RepID=UPI001299F9BC|nr:HTH domain-containing protein [Chitinophaga sp. SYP-B3965]MRG47480.1 HTH domain-containing protein [Chitinophaga sp. SYP-B3965]
MPKRYFERLQTIDYLIRIKGTGKPAQLAKRLRISERTLYEFLKLMKDLGAPIEYDRYKESYYYGEKGGFSIKFTKSIAGASPAAILCLMIMAHTCM